LELVIQATYSLNFYSSSVDRLCVRLQCGLF